MYRFENETAESTDERTSGVGRDFFARDDQVKLFEFIAELEFIEGNGDVAEAHHTAGGCKLVFVAMLAEAR